MAKENETSLCDKCGNPKKDPLKCYDMECYWYSKWMPEDGMSPEDIEECRAQIEDLNW